MSGPVAQPGTPLPWYANGFNIKSGLATGRGNRIIIVTAKDLGLFGTAAERDANAAYIVTACNAYPGLVAALEAVTDSLEAELLAKGTYDVPRKMDRDMADVRQARAALAKEILQ
jgi:hypothetical protein